MKPYKNLDKTSGVVAFEVGADFIKIKFVDGGVYLYNSKSPGREHVDKMKSLALRGHGLASYINRHVRKNFAAQIS